MKIDENEIYPNIGITVKAAIEQIGNNFAPKIEMHISGPDDIFYSTGPLLQSKEQATIWLFKNFTEKVNRLWAEANQ